MVSKSVDSNMEEGRNFSYSEVQSNSNNASSGNDIENQNKTNATSVEEAKQLQYISTTPIILSTSVTQIPGFPQVPLQKKSNLTKEKNSIRKPASENVTEPGGQMPFKFQSIQTRSSTLPLYTIIDRIIKNQTVNHTSSALNNNKTSDRRLQSQSHETTPNWTSIPTQVKLPI